MPGPRSVKGSGSIPGGLPATAAAIQVVVLLCLAMSLLLTGCQGTAFRIDGGPTMSGASAAPTATPSLPAELSAGRALYRTHCQSCHGVAGAGSEMGPPMVHELYRRSNLSDEDIAGSVLFGTKQKNWEYGDMFPVAGVEVPQIEAITRYLRHLQDETASP